jgi:hypothetical protein
LISSFASVERAEPGDVSGSRVVSPDGEDWNFLPDQPAVTTFRGSAVDLCAVAARRVDPHDTSLSGEGPDAADVLALVRTYA